MSDSSGHSNPDSWAEVPPPAPTPEPPGGGWQPPAGGWQPPGGGWQWGGPAAGGPGPSAPLRKRRTSPAVTALLVAGAAVVSVGAGHYLWSTSAGTAADARASSPSSNSLPSQSPGYGESPFGSGGESPFGSGGGYPGGSSNAGSGSGATSAASGSPSDISAIAAKVEPALVDINTTFNYQSASGAGTGIVLTSNGEVLTNNHVINGATSISVTDIGNGRTYEATVVGYDSSADVAVLKLQGASGLQTAHFAKSSSVKVGDAVVALGNAGGTGGTPSSAGGSVTALDQAITASDELDGTSEQLAGLIEVNADIQPGDSGGSLVNSSGQVIGMDTAASSGYSLQSQTNRGYAIPIDTALSIARQIESGTSSSTVHVGPTAFLGVLISSSGSGQGSGYFGGFGSGSTTSGAAVSSVVPGGAAATAGITGGDTITAVNGQTISNASALSSAVAQERPGQRVQLTWTDAYGQSHSATVDLGSGPPA